jgi:predicted nucleic acid-binding protein
MEETRLLPILFGEIVLPGAVESELLSPFAPSMVSKWIAKPPAWLKVRRIESLDPRTDGLDAGEREAISLALRLNGSHLLMDDFEGRQVAIQLNFHVTGTIGILRQAVSERLISATVAYQELTATNFRLSRRLRAELMNHLTSNA